MGTLGCQHVRFILVLFSLAHNLHKAYAPLFCASEHTIHPKVYHPHPKTVSVCTVRYLSKIFNKQLDISSVYV